MSNETPSLSPESQKALEQQAIKTKLAELDTISRISVNALNLLCSNDITIPSAYAKPVVEIQDWLQSVHTNVQSQANTLRSLLPQEPAKTVAETPSVPEAPKDAVVDQASDKAVKLEVVEPAKKDRKSKKAE